jgi:hypothetical protein
MSQGEDYGRRKIPTLKILKGREIKQRCIWKTSQIKEVKAGSL